MKKKQSMDRLSKFIDTDVNKTTRIYHRNSFALCCYLAKHGEVQAAKKQLRCLFNVLGWDRRQVYFTAIMSSIEEHAVDYASEICANLEINKLFNDYE